MTKRMLIDAAHPEETRVVIVDSNRVEELDFESRNKRQLRGNVYLARVTRVEPSLQAAFIEYGGNRHGFLAFSEIHPDYYKIPEADKLALKEQEEEDQRQADEDEEKRKAASARRKSRTKRDEDESDDFQDDSDEMDSDEEDEDEDERDENVDPDDDDATDETDAEVADEQVNVASKRRKRISRRRYKIQEVIKRGQILLVQAVKEERGNKGAAMTTYLSLAGRYCVLMPNTPRGGGISRKISNGSDRKRLKSIMNNLEVPQGMGVIVRTAGAKRTKSEIGHDYDYLSRLWSDIRNTTMESSAPALIHEEGNLVKRSIRDLYNKDIEEILVQGKDAHKTASDFINMLMPSHAKFVKHYDDQIPLFLRYGAEKQIENSLDATVQLKSGGYLVIHPTEALISVDVNSGRSTKERNIERTALKTNMEAAEELARQMRLRDLAGLIVVDFIDMDEHKNNRAVERKMKEMLAKDRARIQTSRISQFGLMEISRQRRRRSLLEGSTTSCPHCSGVGRKRTIESSALAAIRAVEEFAVRGKAKRIRLKTSHDVALYLLNEKRDLLTQVDDIADVFTEVVGSDDLIRPHFELEVVEKREDKRSDPLIQIERDFKKEREAAKRKPKAARSEKSKDESDETENTSPEDESDEENRKSGRRRSRRGRRGGRGRGRKDESPQNEDSSEAESAEETSSETETEAKPKAKRGRRRAPAKGKAESTKSEETKSEDAKSNESTGKGGRRRRAPSKSKDKPVEAVAETVEKVEPESPKRRSTTRRKAPSRNKEVATETSDTSKRTRKAPTKKAPAKKAEEPSETEAKKPTRKRRAPAKKTTVTAKSKPEAKTTRTRKAPAKKPTAEETEAPKPARKRRAPAKKKAEAKVDAADKEKKPARTRKAPAKKAEPAETKAPKKKAVKKKAPAKKATAKASVAKTTEAEIKPKRTRKAPVKKATATKKAPAKKAAPKAAKPAEAKAAPKRTRKAPTKAPAAPASVPAPKAEATQAAEAPKTTEKKPKGGWWKRRKKD
ncbi:MAG: Rne/Rng family ribonuclease [Litorimonas sp.]